ncbi:LptA/OstA family protein [Phenylobacterium sp.]|uniref:LptA/OstA family protein n=1 Tax=Phenylobacterium sp. TaxID=1871053 RepID=UPI002FE409D1
MKLLSTITAAALALAAVPAVAQLAQDTSAPVDITADELEVINTECVSIWRGSAEALQADARLRANVLTARFQTRGATTAGAGDCGDLVRMEAQGQVYYATPQQRVRADNAVYEATGETLTMTGDVVAVQGQNVLRGTRMVINTRTGQGTMQGAATGRNQTGRVRGVFYPSQQSAPARP